MMGWSGTTPLSPTKGPSMQVTFGQRIPGLTVEGTEIDAAVFNEREVRAAAGLTMVAGAVAFSFAYFNHQYIPLQVVSSFFVVEFLIRLTAGLRYSPMGALGHLMTRSLPVEWVSAKPKRFAWTLGLGMSFSMMIITNSGIRGLLPRSICALCLTLMWLESVLGLCVGCKLHALLVRRGWRSDDPAYEICAGGECALPVRAPAAAPDRGEELGVVLDEDAAVAAASGATRGPSVGADTGQRPRARA